MTPVRTSLNATRVAGALTPHLSISGSQPNLEARRKYRLLSIPEMTNEPSSPLCATPESTRSSGLRTAWIATPAMGSPLLPVTRPRMNVSCASRKFRTVVPARSILRSAISVARPVWLTRTE